MSNHDDDPPPRVQSETTPLISSNGSSPHSPPITRKIIPPKKARLILLALIPFIHLGVTVSATTILDVFRGAICRLWHARNDAFPPLPGEELDCTVPGVSSGFSALMTTLSTFEGMGGFVTYTMIGRKAGVYGRKPFMIILLLVDCFGGLLLPLSTLARKQALEIALQIVWILKSTIASIFTHSLISNLMLVDWTEPRNRTRWLLFGSGLASLGRAPAYVLGGYITKKTGNPSIVFILASCVHFCMATVVYFFLPESFGREKREQLLRERLAQEYSTTDHNRKESIFQQLVSTIRTPMLLLGLLLPKKDEVTGERKTRLFFIAAAFFCGSFVAAYAAQALLVYATTRFRFDVTMNGIMLTVLTATQIMWLLVIAPQLLPLIDNYYYKPSPPSDPNSETTSLLGESPEAAVPDVEEDEKKASAVGRRDVHVAMFSFTVESLFQLFVGLSRTGPQLIAATSLWGLTGSSSSAIRSLAAASVPPLRTGEALSAVEMVASIALMFAPLQGVLLTLVINTMPQIVFFIGAVIALMGTFFMFFVRDSQRYHPPRAPPASA